MFIYRLHQDCRYVLTCIMHDDLAIKTFNWSSGHFKMWKIIFGFVFNLLIRCLFSYFSPHQSLHFFYGLGALVSPVIAEPFLRSACTDGHFQTNIFGWTLENSTLEGLMEYNIDGMQVNMTALNETMSQVSRHYHTKSFVQYAYWLIALLQVRMPVFLSVCLFVYCLGLSVSRHYYQVPCTVCLPRLIALHLRIEYFTKLLPSFQC